MSKPISGMLAGLVAGAVVGVAAIIYLEVGSWLDRWCVLGSAILFSQLLGATLASALGKPHRID